MAGDLLESWRPKRITAPNLIEVAAGLIFRAGRLLITQRYAHAHLGGLWEFPGGKREPNETFESCLLRELREELGIEVSILAVVENLTHHYPDKSVHLRFYRCRLDSGEPQALACAACQWVTKDELSEYEFPAADARLLQRLRSSKEFWLDTPSV